MWSRSLLALAFLQDLRLSKSQPVPEVIFYLMTFVADRTDSGKYVSPQTVSTGSSGQQQQQITTKVDTESTKNALRLAAQAKEMGVSTLVELTVQAGTVSC